MIAYLCDIHLVQFLSTVVLFTNSQYEYRFSMNIIMYAVTSHHEKNYQYRYIANTSIVILE